MNLDIILLHIFDGILTRNLRGSIGSMHLDVTEKIPLMSGRDTDNYPVEIDTFAIKLLIKYLFNILATNI